LFTGPDVLSTSISRRITETQEGSDGDPEGMKKGRWPNVLLRPYSRRVYL
jgi:hypothetical protein